MSELFAKTLEAWEAREQDAEAADDALNEFFQEFVVGTVRSDKSYAELHEGVAGIIREHFEARGRLEKENPSAFFALMEKDIIDWLKDEPPPEEKEKEQETKRAEKEIDWENLPEVDKDRLVAVLKARGVKGDAFDKALEAWEDIGRNRVAAKLSNSVGKILETSRVK